MIIVYTFISIGQYLIRIYRKSIISLLYCSNKIVFQVSNNLINYFFDHCNQITYEFVVKCAICLQKSLCLQNKIKHEMSKII